MKRTRQHRSRQSQGRRSAAVFLALAMSFGVVVFASPPASADCWYKDPITLEWRECALVEGEYEPGYDAAWTEYYEENSHNAGNSSSSGNSGTSTSSNNNGDSEEAPAPTPETDPCKIDGFDALCQACKHEKDPCDATLKSILTDATTFAAEFCGNDQACRSLFVMAFVFSAYNAETGNLLPDDLFAALRNDVQVPNAAAGDVWRLSSVLTLQALINASKLSFDSDADRTRYIRHNLRSLIRKAITESQNGGGIKGP